MNISALSDDITDLTPNQWRAVLLAAAQHRCIACGEFDACDCSDEVDAAKVLVVDRAAVLVR